MQGWAAHRVTVVVLAKLLLSCTLPPAQAPRGPDTWERSPPGHSGAVLGKGVAIPSCLAFCCLAWRTPFQTALSLSSLMACEVGWCPCFMEGMCHGVVFPESRSSRIRTSWTLEPCTLKVLKASFFREGRLGSESVLGGVSPPACWPSSHLTAFPCPRPRSPWHRRSQSVSPGRAGSSVSRSPLHTASFPPRGWCG